MEEDVLGTKEEVVGDRYTLCSRCRRPIMRREATLDDNETIEESRSEQEELCPVCRRQVEEGEGTPPA